MGGINQRYIANAPYELQRSTQMPSRVRASRTEKGPHFDLDRVWKEGLSFSRADFDRWVASHRDSSVYSKYNGLPPRVGIRVVSANGLELAARELCQYEPDLSSRLVLRAANYETRGTLNFLLSRAPRCDDT